MGIVPLAALEVVTSFDAVPVDVGKMGEGVFVNAATGGYALR